MDSHLSFCTLCLACVEHNISIQSPQLDALPGAINPRYAALSIVHPQAIYLAIYLSLLVATLLSCIIYSRDYLSPFLPPLTDGNSGLSLCPSRVACNECIVSINYILVAGQLLFFHYFSSTAAAAASSPGIIHIILISGCACGCGPCVYGRRTIDHYPLVITIMRATGIIPGKILSTIF